MLYIYILYTHAYPYMFPIRTASHFGVLRTLIPHGSSTTAMALQDSKGSLVYNLSRRCSLMIFWAQDDYWVIIFSRSYHIPREFEKPILGHNVLMIFDDLL